MDPKSQFAALLEQGYLARREGRPVDANAAYMAALQIAESGGDSALALTRLGGIERDMGNDETALGLYRQAVEIYRGLDEPLKLAHTVRHVGDIAHEVSQLELAAACFSEALSIYRSHSETGTLDLANTLRGYALLQTDLGRIEEAIALWREAGQLYDKVWREPGSPFEQADLAPGIAESQRQVALLAAR